MELIIVDHQVQPRDHLDEEVVQRYADLYMDDSVELPPVRVHEIQGDFYLCDGFTRHSGATQAKKTHMRCDVREKSTRGALVVDAIHMNAIHGQPLTASERRRAIARLASTFLESDLPWSQSDIAGIVGVSQSTVSRIIKQDIGDIDLEHKEDRDIVGEIVEDEINLEDAMKVDDEEIEDDESPAARARRLQVEATIERGQEVADAIYQHCRKITEHLHVARSTPGCESIAQNLSTLTVAKDTLLDVREMRPEMMCPNCNGFGCAPCHQRGWLNKNESRRAER
jgi:predicted transcriptional regulator